MAGSASDEKPQEKGEGITEPASTSESATVDQFERLASFGTIDSKIAQRGEWNIEPLAGKHYATKSVEPLLSRRQLLWTPQYGWIYDVWPDDAASSLPPVHKRFSIVANLQRWLSRPRTAKRAAPPPAPPSPESGCAGSGTPVVGMQLSQDC